MHKDKYHKFTTALCCLNMFYLGQAPGRGAFRIPLLNQQKLISYPLNARYQNYQLAVAALFLCMIISLTVKIIDLMIIINLSYHYKNVAIWYWPYSWHHESKGAFPTNKDYRSCAPNESLNIGFTHDIMLLTSQKGHVLYQDLHHRSCVPIKVSELYKNVL